jgi:nicotinamide riboside kinase
VEELIPNSMNKKNTILINCFGGPSSGKSTMCAGLFTKLKCLGVDSEMALEYAKDVIWEESFKKLDNQIYIFAKQLHRLKRLQGKVDVIITDSPIILSTIYVDAYNVKEDNTTFKKLIIEEHRKFNAINFFIKRVHTYEPNGRLQTLEQAEQIDNKIKEILTKNELPFEIIIGDLKFIDDTAERIMKAIEKTEELNFLS